MFTEIVKNRNSKAGQAIPAPHKTILKGDRYIKRQALFGVVGSLCALASPAQAKFDGFYAGGSLGYLQQNTTLNAQQNPGNPKADMHNTTSVRGLPTVELFLGWGKIFERSFYVGIEGKVDWAATGKRKIAEDINFSYLSSRKNPGVALLGRLGYLVSPQTLVYGGVGAKWVGFRYNVFEKVDQIPAPFSKQSVHLLTEVGVETALPALKNWAVRLSYSFMPKRDITQTGQSFPANHMYQQNGSLKVGMAEHAIKIGLLYQF